MERIIVSSLTIDHLRVFVSSTITECAKERCVVRKAIRSINHEPILFEDIGARPYPPREVYKSRLESSQIFIGIYRESYGWAAPDMEVSGIEDEYRIATERGMDRLIYIYKIPSSRDTKLQDLIDEIKNSGITISFYRDPEELERRVRDDLTSLVSNRFVDQAIVSQESPSSEEVLQSLVPNPIHRFRRRNAEIGLINALNAYSRIVVTAPMGGGKTILIAQLSVENGWIFVDGRSLNRLDLLARTANAIRQRLGWTPVTLTTEQAAIQELKNSWGALPNIPIVVDGASEPLVLWEIAAGTRQLIVTSRSPLRVPSNQHFELPLLTGDEIHKWVSALRGTNPDPGELANLVIRSKGNPLYLRYYALGGKASADLSLQELEIHAIQSLPPPAREITSYLALSPRPLSLGALLDLVDTDQGPEAVAEHVSNASGLVIQLRGQIALVHEHLRGTVLDQLHNNPVRIAFFASRLGRYFENSERHLAAFHVYLVAGEHSHMDRVLPLAANQALLMGGGAPAIPIFRRQAELAEQRGAIEERLYALLALAFAFKQTGARDEADCALEQARATAQRLNQTSLFLRVREMEAVLNLRERPRSERIADLIGLRSSFTENNDVFNAARIGTLLAAEYIFGRDFRSAVEISRVVLQEFNEFGDEYGARVARLNLAASLSAIEGNEREAAAIAQDLDREITPDEYPRERAVLCNYLTRHYRELGDTNRAAEFALEAIRIGEQLSDLHVISINRTMLGNLKRDEGNLEQALIEYQAADQAAVEAGLRDAESAANELIASVYNEREEYRLALHHAAHAAGAARLAGDHVLIARAEEERAIALNGQQNLEAAISAYKDAATAIATFRPGGSYFVSLIGDALHLCTTSKKTTLKIRLLADLFAPDLKPIGDEGGIDPVQMLYSALPKMADTISRIEHLLPIVALSITDLLADIPPLVARRIILQATDALIPHDSEFQTTTRLTAVAGILMAQSGIVMTLSDVADIAERIAESSSRIYFKPHADGRGHWTLRLRNADGVIVTLGQLDDSPTTAVTTTILALLLSGLDSVVREAVTRCRPHTAPRSHH